MIMQINLNRYPEWIKAKRLSKDLENFGDIEEVILNWVHVFSEYELENSTEYDWLDLIELIRKLLKAKNGDYDCILNVYGGVGYITKKEESSVQTTVIDKDTENSWIYTFMNTPGPSKFIEQCLSQYHEVLDD